MIDHDAIRARIAEVREHDAKATPKPWKDDGGYRVRSPEDAVVADIKARWQERDLVTDENDVAAITAFRSLAPQLADDAEGLLEENERLETENRELSEDEAIAEQRVEDIESLALGEIAQLRKDNQQLVEMLRLLNENPIYWRWDNHKRGRERICRTCGAVQSNPVSRMKHDPACLYRRVAKLLAEVEKS